MGFVAARHVGSSQTREPTCVPCIGRRILNHCATREVLDQARYLQIPPGLMGDGVPILQVRQLELRGVQ